MADEQTEQDRKALEQIMGSERSSTSWPVDAWPVGTRVRVVKDSDWDGPWRQEFLGTVDDTMPPRLIESKVAHPGELAYFVAFDEPQHDTSDDGPYRKAEIWARYLRLVGESTTGAG